MLIATLALSSAAAAAQIQYEAPRTARTNYMERCGGCHGLEGHSASSLVPDLKGRAGYFLCNRQSRDYIGRLPNLVFSQISDEEMTALLNYVVFELGASSAPIDAASYQTAEIIRMRRSPLTTTDLLTYRKRVIDSVIRECKAPESLRTDYAPPRPNKL